MRATRWIIAGLLALATATGLPAQEKEKEQARAEPAALNAAFRIQVVLSEYDGTAKIASLPYTLAVAPANPTDKVALGSVRVGLRVPVPATNKAGESVIQYMDVGTNVDVRVRPAGSDRYYVELTIERSSLYVRERNKEGKAEGRAWAPGDPVPESTPLNQLRMNVEFQLRDGRSAETTAATDPLTGHVYRVDAQLTLLK